MIGLLQCWRRNVQILKAEQGTQEWLDARLGRPSASQFSKLVTTAGKPSASADDYISEMIAERITGEREPIYVNEWMQRGTELEPRARETYEFMYDVDVQEVGFILDDSGEFGCSPDGLIGEDGGVEFKCPAPKNHIAWSRKGKCPSKHYAQVQGCLYITGRKWWDFMSYHPDMKPFVVRVERDEEFIAKLAEQISLAVEEIKSEVENLR
jgi:hypothetical protein